MRLNFKIIVYLFLFVLLLVPPANIRAQSIKPDYSQMEKRLISDSLHIYKLRFKDGSELKCSITSYDSLSVQFKSLAGFSGSVELTKLENIILIKGNWKEDKFIQNSPHNSRMIVSPTGETLPAGSVYLSAAELFFWMISAAPTDYLTFGVGLPFFPNSRFGTYYGYTKVRLIDYNGIFISVGAAGIVGAGNFEYAPFEVISYSAEKFSLTAGLYNNINNSSMFYFGGQIKIGAHSWFITENWIVPNSKINAFFFAIRYSGEYFSSDIGFVNAWESRDGFPFLPWIGLNYNF